MPKLTSASTADCIFYACIVFIIILVLFYNFCQTEQFTDANKTILNIDFMTNDVITHKDLFLTSNVAKVRNKINWVDPVYYYDICTLFANNKNATSSDIKSVLYNSMLNKKL